MLRRASGALVALLCLALSSAALASVAAGLDLATLVARSEHAVAGEVQATTCRYDAEGRIVTDVLVRVDEVGKGPARRGDVLQLLVLGGSVGGVTMRVEGGASLTEGEHALLFVERHATGNLIPVGLSQGVMPIRDEGGRRVVHPGGGGLALLRRDEHGRMVPTTAALTEPEELGSLLERVRALAAGGTR